ncbi:MAG: transglutaminaseTgpA domain-containing protein, partial [Planctomycetota bacterium]
MSSIKSPGLASPVTRSTTASPKTPSIRLGLFIAGLVAASGVLLGSQDDTGTIALVAIFSAVFGFLLVDWLRVFYLPPIGAYLAMAGSAIYCVLHFWERSSIGRPQMTSVALLLVLVQGVLMFQPKTRRILDQLAVFCLLELVVAAIFNDALNFGLLLIPITLVGAAVLSLLGMVSALEEIEVSLDPIVPQAPRTRWQRVIHLLAGRESTKSSSLSIASVASPQSAIDVHSFAPAWTRFALIALTPAIVLVGLVFFYALPRKIESARASVGSPMVGFDDEVRLEQLGQVMQNPKIALKVKLTNVRTKSNYRVRNGLYLRGNVLEKYEVDLSGKKPIGKWVASDSTFPSRRRKLPRQLRVSRPDQLAQFDDVQVELTCEAMNQPALFAIAPYHESNFDS